MDNRQNKNRYLSSQTMVMQEIRNVLFIAAGAVSTTFCAIAAAGGILDSAEGLRSGLPVYFGLLVPSLLLLIFGLRGRRLTGAARRYESIFEGDTNGVLTAEELSARMGKDAASVMDELDLLFRKGYFRGCTLSRQGPQCVYLQDERAAGSGLGFVAVTCPKCGGTGRFRAGTVGICEYCGNAVSAISTEDADSRPRQKS